MAQTTTSSTKLPSYVEQPVKTSLKSIEDFLNSDANYVYGSKEGESLYTPLSSSQEKSIGNVDWLADQDLASMFGINQAGDLWQDFSSAEFDKSRLVDEEGSLGAISDYMNPFTQQVLDPQIREINEALKRARMDIGTSSQMGGAFGDARHGVAEGEAYRGAMEEISDTTGQAYANAFDRAMGLRSNDMGRILSTEMQENANKAAGAQGISGLGNQYFNMFTDVNDMLFNAGEVERDAAEEQRQTMQEFQEAIKNKKYEDALKLLMAAQGAPMSTTSTSKTKSNDGIGGLIGATLGALF